jgi:hypothetical protein
MNKDARKLTIAMLWLEILYKNLQTGMSKKDQLAISQILSKILLELRP